MNLKPMSMGEILDNSFTMYKRQVKTYLKISSPLMLGFLLLLIPFMFIGESSLESPIFIILGALIIFLAYTAIFFVTCTGIMYAASEQVANRQVDAGAALKFGFSKIGVQLLASFLYCVAVIIGFVLLVIPGIYLSTALVFCITAVALENKGPWSSLKRSRELTKGSWWRVAITLFLISILIGIISYIIQIPVILLTTSLFSDTVTAEIINSIVSMILTWITTPIMSIVLTLLYYDLRVRKESLDLQLAVEAVTETKNNSL